MSNCDYDKIKILYKISKLIGFIENHAGEDAEDQGHGECKEAYSELKQNLEKSLDKLSQLTKIAEA